ncbi:hypothetical protein TVAG_214060 [Trichomonas vaginalis G3]|uniref:Uncharacterized protein n=1 Tax=Trichomonas vaginalis (strain ATCC PRA-98 / G3) TaxID=412133 RepID=A2DK10_TRIV3|nr:hypothetical protein TVAGG3_0169360 [Trichomonas vaginalis G3]EAY19181.1 hypothetical protein TVAG_214060 [Trichomonas vaginalis G3]KAI5548465.1 hypothetical protein TVAGG3_0169360 [Trichomonas vaginalis G3]|eukprot:XP_001580167.1 hypothetical protein [Trichomonas vaginalis G3]
MEKQIIDDKKFDSSIKSIIQRDFFPELGSTKQPDPSTANFSLQTFCNTYAPQSDHDFVTKVERDRIIQINSAPASKLDKQLENDTRSPYKREAFNSLFFQPQAIKHETPLALTYQQKKKPQTILENTHFHNGRPISLNNNINYHPFTTESSTTESESDFEGRSKYRSEIIRTMPTRRISIKKDRLVKMNLTQKGRELLDSMSK